MDKNVEKVANSIKDINDFLKSEIEKDEADNLTKSESEKSDLLKAEKEVDAEKDEDDEDEDEKKDKDTEDNVEKSIDEQIDVEPVLKSVAEGYDNQTKRLEVLTKSIQGLISVIQANDKEKDLIIKSMNDKIEVLEKSEVPMNGIYNSSDMLKANSIKIKGSNGEIPLSKSLVLKTMLKGMQEGKVDGAEIVKYEMSNTPMLKSLSVKTQNYIQSEIDMEVSNVR